MPLARLIYVSENLIDAPGSLLTQLSAILKSSEKNNKADDVTGALVFDDAWFIQVLEGEKRRILATFERISLDDRHCNASLVELVDVEKRLFGNWWMGFATRTAATSHLFAPYTRNGILHADEMAAGDLLGLVIEVSKLGLTRGLVERAA